MIAGRRAAVLAVAVTCAAVLSGCAASPDDDSPMAGEGTAGFTLTLEEVARLGMLPDAKRDKLSEDFPSQVPVMDGDVASVSRYGSSWVYRIEVRLAAAQATEWYRRAYANANWHIADERSVRSETGSATTLEFWKGAGAQSLITVRAKGDVSLVEGTVGLGASIGEPQ